MDLPVTMRRRHLVRMKVMIFTWVKKTVKLRFCRELLRPREKKHTVGCAGFGLLSAFRADLFRRFWCCGDEVRACSYRSSS